MMNSVNRVVGLSAILGGILLIFLGWRFDPGTAKLPGPGFWPILIALAMSGIGIRLFLYPGGDEKSIRFQSSRVKPFVIALLSIIGYGMVRNEAGYLLSTAALLVIQLRWVEKQSWRTSCVTAVAASLISWVLFRMLLKVPLPMGIFPMPKGW